MLALVFVLRHDRALRQEHLGHHRLFSGNDLAGDGWAQDFFAYLVPGVVFHVSDSIAPRPHCDHLHSSVTVRMSRSEGGAATGTATGRLRPPRLRFDSEDYSA